MSPKRKRINQLPLVQWMTVDFGIIALLSFAWSVEGRLAVYSALIGGLIFVIPNAYFARQTYRYEGARSAPMLVSSMFRAEGIKLALTAVFFAAVFILIEPVHVPALLFTFAVLVVLNPFVRWFFRPKIQR